MKKLVVITGASSGFGKALALAFSKAGYPLLLLARRVELLTAMNLENALCEQVDVRDMESFTAAIRKAEAQFGPTDLLINNAGVMLLGNMEDQNPQEWKDMLDINVLGMMNGVQIVLHDMKQRQTGTIINVSSIAGVKAFGDHAAYCASKYAVMGLSETLRMESASSNVRIMRVCPGAVATELLSHTTSEAIKTGYNAWKEATGVGSISAEDVANTIKFAYELPQGVNLREIQIADTRQDS
ncbi:MAG: SDR family oxidoreductase [Erysipelotrichaceae bacterium]